MDRDLENSVKRSEGRHTQGLATAGFIQEEIETADFLTSDDGL